MNVLSSLPKVTDRFDWVAFEKRLAFPLFFVLALIVSVAVSVVTPPFTNPDEGAHYLRSYEVSRGHLVNTKDNVGVPIPCADYLIIGSKYAPIAFFQDVASQAVNADCTVRSVNSAGVYPPVSYAFSALGIRFSELWRMTPEQSLVTARIFNGLASSVLILFALASIRHYRLLLVALILMPTVVWQRSALTADALTLTFCFLLVACLIRIAETDRPPTRRHVAILCGLGILLGSTKLVYSLLAFASLIFLWQRPAGQSRLRWLVLLSLPGILGIGAAMLWLKLPDPALFYLGNGADPGGQIAHALKHPIEFLQTIYRTVANPGHSISFVAANFPLHEALGAVSWYGPILGFLTVTTPGLFSLKQRAVLMLVALAACGAALLPTYLTYTPVGYHEILGIQGRYFIPIVIFGLVSLTFARRDWLYLNRPIRIGLGILIPLMILARLIGIKS